MQVSWLGVIVSSLWDVRHVRQLIVNFLCPLWQADERYRKNHQGSPQTAPPKQPPVPPRSSEPYSNGNSLSESSSMHKPMEPQVMPDMSLAFPPLTRRTVFCYANVCMMPDDFIHSVVIKGKVLSVPSPFCVLGCIHACPSHCACALLSPSRTTLPLLLFFRLPQGPVVSPGRSKEQRIRSPRVPFPFVQRSSS